MRENLAARKYLRSQYINKAHFRSEVYRLHFLYLVFFFHNDTAQVNDRGVGAARVYLILANTKMRKEVRHRGARSTHNSFRDKAEA